MDEWSIHNEFLFHSPHELDHESLTFFLLDRVHAILHCDRDRLLAQKSTELALSRHHSASTPHGFPWSKDFHNSLR